MLGGIVFFSQIMGSFIEMINSYAARMGSDDRGSELNTWMNLLNRFSEKPLPSDLVNQIDKHYSYQWNNDRLSSIKKDNEYLNQCPRQVKNYIMKNYLFDDIIFNHRFFFNTNENKNSKFLYDVCFGLVPAKFDSSESDRLILDEDNYVTDLYFIQEGTVGIGYYLMN